MQGVITALITPFKNDQVDYSGLETLIEYQIKGGVYGILVLGTTGEAPTLTAEEQREIIKFSKEKIRGRCHFMVGATTNATRTTIANVAQAKELGADSVLIASPYYNKPSQEGLLAHYQAITSAVSIPVMVYNIAGRTGVNIETATMKKIAALPNVVAVKEASGNLGQIQDVISEIQMTHKNFKVMSGDDSLTLPVVALGGTGIVSVVSNLFPAEMVALTKAALAGDFTKARELHYQLSPIFKGAFIESNPMPIKLAMAMAGLPAGEPRLPLVAAKESTRNALQPILSALKKI